MWATTPRSRQSQLAVIFIAALTFRLLFTFLIQSYIYGEFVFTNGDSFSYINSFLNLYENGNYTFDPSHPDASIFRPPVYPFFWGLHYLAVGDDGAY